MTTNTRYRDHQHSVTSSLVTRTVLHSEGRSAAICQLQQATAICREVPSSWLESDSAQSADAAAVASTRPTRRRRHHDATISRPAYAICGAESLCGLYQPDVFKAVPRAWILRHPRFVSEHIPRLGLCLIGPGSGWHPNHQSAQARAGSGELPARRHGAPGPGPNRWPAAITVTGMVSASLVIRRIAGAVRAVTSVVSSAFVAAGRPGAFRGLDWNTVFIDESESNATELSFRSDLNSVVGYWPSGSEKK